MWSFLMMVLDMTWFVVELPLRWKSTDFKPGLPMLMKIRYGLWLNAVTDMWLWTSGIRRRDMDRSSPLIVKNYIGLVNAIDDFLDDPKNKRKDPGFNADAGIRAMRKRLFRSIEQYDGSLQKKIKRVLSESSCTMMGATARLRDTGVSSLDGALAVRESTSGELARATAEIFNVIHGVSPGKAKAIERVYANVGMIIQIHDDVGDVGRDARKGICENLILQMLNERPDEKARLMEALAGEKTCTYGMLARLAPETARAARDLQDRYIEAIPETDRFDRIKCLLNIWVSLRGQSAAFRLIVGNMDL